jgi:murein L,D-transpeptidase YcbB/YkuD
MERMRWLPRDLGKRHILVNQTAFRLRLYDDSEIVHTANVVIGKRSHSTPVFSEVMEHIVLNPYWNVPRSIATKEMLPQLAQDPAYLARQGYEVFEMDGRKASRIDSAGVSWWQVGRQTFNYQIRQPPGRSNALGRLKFMFPNRFNIYLHDTPSKSLFSRSSRAFSHGCVRLQNPQRLAEILLGWDKGWNAHKISRMVDSGRNQAIFLDKKIPIYLTYLTAWVDDDGEVAYLDDVYGRDPALMRAFVEYRVAMK